VRFDVSGGASRDESTVLVSLRLRNAGSAAAKQVFVEARLGDSMRELEVSRIAAGATHDALLPFPVPSRPGLHALRLRIESLEDGAPEGTTRKHQPACVLLAIGETGEKALGVEVPPGSIDVEAHACVRIQSLDHESHRARLFVLPPYGVNVIDAPSEVDVPAQGSASVSIRLLRGSAPRGTRQALLVVAAPLDGAFERAVLASGSLDMAPDPALLPRLRRALAALAVCLLLLALVIEWRAKRAQTSP
jgi:hypothetical protein